MKIFTIIVFSFVTSTAAFASGFVCQGGPYRVKMYNQVQPELGTANPAVLIVSKDGVGTSSVLKDDEIQKIQTGSTVLYRGLGNSKIDGRFSFVSLEVEKQPLVRKTGGFTVYTETHRAWLTVNENHTSNVATVFCKRYLKGNR